MRRSIAGLPQGNWSRESGSIRMALFVGALAVAWLLASTASVQASTGTITRAYTNAEWTKGSLAGEINFSGCESAHPCEWLPLAFVQPSLPEYQCWGEEWISTDHNIRVVWNGGEQPANGIASFNLSNVNILQGVYGQRLCVIVVKTVKMRNEDCEKIEELWGKNPENCPIENVIYDSVVASSLLTVEPPPPPTSETTPPPTTDKPLKCRKGFKRRSRKCVRVTNHRHHRHRR